MPEWTLAIGGSEHDPSAALVCDSDIRVAVEQERLTRRKHGVALWYESPIQQAIDYCLTAEGINYLIGRQWINANLKITPSNYMWIPDDFGHDAQLPIVLQAMGFRGAGFWRIPVNAPNAPLPNSVAPSSRLLNTGVDFTWKAADGSSIQAHWLLYSYCQGNNALTQGSEITWGSDAQGDINELVQQSLYYVTSDGNDRFSSSSTKEYPPLPQPTPYMFAPIDCDFSLPYTNLADIVYQWNQCNSGSGQNCATNPPYTKGITVAMSTFADFMDQVYEYNQRNNSLPVYVADQSAEAWVPNPFYSGTYGSQPALKRLHYKTTRELLLAEAMEILLEYLADAQGGSWVQTASSARDAIASAWNELMPSTHHDYITGTAGVSSGPPTSNPVYTSEQLPDLENALQQADTALTTVLNTLAEIIMPSQSEGAAAVFNGLGFARVDIAEMLTSASDPIYKSSTMDGTTFTPVQYTDNGIKLLFMAEAPSMGYSCVNLSANTPTSSPNLSLNQSNGEYVLSNQFLSATVSLGNPTGITALVDQQTGANIISGTGNEVVPYIDEGNIYRFANELAGNYSFYADESLGLENAQLAALENGPLCVSVTVEAQLAGTGAAAIPYLIRYALYANEPFLRAEVSGAAPSGYSVMVRFSFSSSSARPNASPVQALTYGTPYHWDTRQPRNYFQEQSTPTTEQICFEPTHNFVIALDGSNGILGAVYHAHTPAWAIDPQQALLGCILRNVPGEQNAAWASDLNEHKAGYALRVPSGLASPKAGCGFSSPLGEALRFKSPLRGVLLPASCQQELLPATISIAGTNADNALITAAKVGTMNPGDLVLRVYQPVNQSSDIVITVAPQIASLYQENGALNVVSQTALETDLTPPASLAVAPATNSFAFTQQFALATFALQSGS